MTAASLPVPAPTAKMSLWTGLGLTTANGTSIVWPQWDGHDFELYLFDGTSTIRLTDNDLMATAATQSQQHLLAIAQRNALSEQVTDVLVERGEL